MKSGNKHRDDIHEINAGRNGTGPPGIDKAPADIPGLDKVLKEGVPKGAMTLLSGGPGTGKTMLGLEFLVRGAGMQLTMMAQTNKLSQKSQKTVYPS